MWIYSINYRNIFLYNVFLSKKPCYTIASKPLYVLQLRLLGKLFNVTTVKDTWCAQLYIRYLKPEEKHTFDFFFFSLNRHFIDFFSMLAASLRFVSVSVASAIFDKLKFSLCWNFKVSTCALKKTSEISFDCYYICPACIWFVFAQFNYMPVTFLQF